MIKSIPCYTLICDGCGADLYENGEYSGLTEAHAVIDDARDSDWHVEDDKHYCFDCWSFDDDDNLVIKKTIIW